MVARNTEFFDVLYSLFQISRFPIQFTFVMFILFVLSAETEIPIVEVNGMTVEDRIVQDQGHRRTVNTGNE